MQKNQVNIFVALIPVIFLIVMLSFNVSAVFGDDAISGSNQIILILSGALTIGLSMLTGGSFETIINGISKNIKDTTKAILILLLIGALAGSWLISGIIPAFIYYGLQILNASFFLPACVIICAAVSLATGSSWSTSATVGIALVAIGKAMGIDTAMIAGAVISGAYFGDKLSPLSDTTNLAPAMAGAELFSHIRYMMLTTIPSIVITFIIFIVLSLSMTPENNIAQVEVITQELNTLFNVTPILFLAPAITIFLIVKKTDALIAILAGTLIGGLFAVIFQPEIIKSIAGISDNYAKAAYKAIMLAFYSKVEITSNNKELADLLSSKGMSGMLGTVWLIISAMVFGGAMEASGFLQIITGKLVKIANSTASLIGTTLATCGFLNITASDQYLAIVVPGRMFKDIYQKRGLAPENLSRTLEDGGTVTSVLVPWNTCGAYQSSVLGVLTGDYWVYCFFNILSPFMSLVFALFGIKIKPLPKEKRSITEEE